MALPIDLVDGSGSLSVTGNHACKYNGGGLIPSCQSSETWMEDVDGVGELSGCEHHKGQRGWALGTSYSAGLREAWLLTPPCPMSAVGH